MGLNAALSVAARSLEVFSAGIQVAGDNIANAQTPGYVRNQLNLASSSPARQGSLLFGNGVVALGIRQQIDGYLQKRIYSANSEFSAANARNDIWKQLEGAFQELGSSDISTGITSLVGKLNDLANQPESQSVRQLAIQQGVGFTNTLKTIRARVDDLRTSLNTKVGDLTSEANRLIDEIDQLNPRITALESAGLLQSDAGGLRDQRLAALNRLSEILPIHTVEHESGAVDIFLGSESLVLESEVQHLETVATVDRNSAVSQVRTADSRFPLTGSQGELNGVLNGRDAVLGNFVDQLDTLAANAIFEFNKLHASGQGTKGYTSIVAGYAPTDPAAALNAAGLAFTPQNGSFQIKVTNRANGVSTTSSINVDLDGLGTETSLNSLAASIDGLNNVTATVGADRKLSITAGTGYEITFGNDTSNALAALGVNTFFTGTNSQTIGVNAAITGDPALLATGQGGGIADGSNALALARFADNAAAGLNGVSLIDYYQNLVSQVAQSSASESALASGYQMFRDSLGNQRDQYSGVSLDEEVIQMLKFQRAFQMSGKMISTIDELFRTLLQI